MALFKISRGSAANLNTAASTSYATNGFAYFTTDEGKLYIDIDGDGTTTPAVIGENRIPLNAQKADIAALANFANVSARIAFGTCTTAANQAEKEIDIDLDELGTLQSGSMIAVYFLNENTANNPMLSINTNLYPAHYSFTSALGNTPATSWESGSVKVFTYMQGVEGDTTNRFVLTNPYSDYKVTQAESTSSDWRKILLHHSHAAANSNVIEETDIVYAAKDVEVQPSTGTISANKFKGSLEGNADTATTLQNARTIQTDLASTSAASFDGSANIEPGIKGVLPIANGGTSSTSAYSASKNLGYAFWGGYGLNLNTAVDLNEYDARNNFGTYYVENAAMAANIASAPRSNAGFKFLSLNSYDSNRTIQVAWYGGNDPTPYIRVENGTENNFTDWSKVAYVQNAVGSAVNPVYVSATGAIKASAANVGSNTQFTYMANGNITATTAAIGGTTKLWYLNSGVATNSTANVGTNINPVYLANGVVTATTASVGGTEQPIYSNAGVLTNTTYHLKANVSNGTANRITYYSADRTIDAAANLYTTGNYIEFFKDDAAYTLIYNRYNSTSYPLLEDFHNGNIGFDASGNGMYIGYKNTTSQHFYYSTNASNRTEFLQINSNGAYALTRFGVNATTYQHTLGGASSVSDFAFSVLGNGFIRDTIYTNTGVIAYRTAAGYAYRAMDNTVQVGGFYIDTLGTTSKSGLSYMLIGNKSSATTAGNARGRLYLGKTGAAWHIILGESDNATNHSHYLPDATGWIVTAGDGTSTGQGGTEQPVYVDATGVVKDTTYHLKAHVDNGTQHYLTMYTSDGRTIGPASNRASTVLLSSTVADTLKLTSSANTNYLTYTSSKGTWKAGMGPNVDEYWIYSNTLNYQSLILNKQYLILYSNGFQQNTAVTATKYSGIQLRDTNNAYLGMLRGYKGTSNTMGMQLITYDINNGSGAFSIYRTSTPDTYITWTDGKIGNSIYPWSDASYDLGSNALRWRKLYSTAITKPQDTVISSSTTIRSHYIMAPLGGSYATNASSTTGLLKIEFPVRWTSHMINFKVDIYDYSQNNLVTYHIGGYNYSGNSSWNNTSAYSVGIGNKSNLAVRFCDDGTHACVTIGETNTSWSYIQINIRDVYIGYNSGSIDSWNNAWKISFVTTQPTISNSQEKTDPSLVQDGTATRMAYYATARSVAAAPQIQYIPSQDAELGTTKGKVNGLFIFGAPYGNTTANLGSATVNVFRYGDPGPQIRFGSSLGTANAGGAESSAIIWSDNSSSIGTDQSFHFVGQTDTSHTPSNVGVVTNTFIGKTRISAGVHYANTNYVLFSNGTSGINGQLYLQGGSTSRDTAPSSNDNRALYFTDAARDSQGYIYFRHNTAGTHLMYLGTYSSGTKAAKDHIVLTSDTDTTDPHYIQINTRISTGLNISDTRGFAYNKTNTPGVCISNAGRIYITANSNTVTIGSQNASFTHIYNSADIPFIVNKSFLTASGSLGNTSYPWNNIYLGNSAGTANADIVLHSSKSNNTMIRFLVNTTNGDGQGIRIGGGGLTIIGSGESAATVQTGTGYASDNEQMLITGDNEIRFYPNQGSAYTASALIQMTAGRIWAGVNGDTTRENQIGVQSGAGPIYMYSAAATTGAKGIYFAAANGNPAGYIAHVDSAHRVYFNSNFTSQRVKLINKDTTAAGIAAGTWLRTCIVQAYNNYANFQIRLTGGWSTGSPTVATIDVHMRNGQASMKLVHCGFLGVIGKVKLVKIATNTAYVDVYVNEVTKETEYFGQFIGNVVTSQTNDTTHGSVNVTTTDATGLATLDLTVGVGNGTTPVYINAAGKPTVCTAYGSATVGTANNLKTTLMTNSSTAIYVLGATGTTADTSTSVYKAYRTSTAQVYFRGDTGVLMGAAWNDYAEYRQAKNNVEIEPGRVVKEVGDETLELATSRLQRGCSIVSNTFGISIGESEINKLPLAVAGRVLAYPYESLSDFKECIGWPVCSGPNGTVSIMTEEEERDYPSRIIGTIASVPDYEVWHGGADVEVNGRVWIKVR